jgi:hypothetical protein
MLQRVGIGAAASFFGLTAFAHFDCSRAGNAAAAAAVCEVEQHQQQQLPLQGGVRTYVCAHSRCNQQQSKTTDK